jgi:hypothetical protein
MNKNIELALATQVYQLVSANKASTTYPTYTQTKDGIKEDGSVNCVELIKEIMNSGVSPITVLDLSYEKRPLIFHVFSNTAHTKILEIFIDALQKEHLDNLDQSTLKKMYNSINVDDYAGVSGKLLRKYFELGFDFEQGTFSEDYKAEGGNQEFFEICMHYKKDFKFDFKYKEYYLDELVKEDLECLKPSDPEYKTKENLMIFLKKAREVYGLRDSLEEDLPANTSKSNKYKI